MQPNIPQTDDIPGLPLLLRRHGRLHVHVPLREDRGYLRHRITPWVRYGRITASLEAGNPRSKSNTGVLAICSKGSVLPTVFVAFINRESASA